MQAPSKRSVSERIQSAKTPAFFGRGFFYARKGENNLLFENRTLKKSFAPILLEPDQSLPVIVRFTPVEKGFYAAVIRLGIQTGDLDVILTGEGVESLVVINEVLADPPQGQEGDANGDGSRHSSEDEFVEIMNIGKQAVHIGGWQLADRGTAPGGRFSFPEGTFMGRNENQTDGVPIEALSGL